MTPRLSRSLLFVLCVGFVGCGSDQQVHFILPEGFKGEVTVICDEPCGIPAVEADPGVTVFNIPESGILITQLPQSCDIGNRKYFFKTTSGQLIEIPKMMELEEIRNWTSSNNVQDTQREEVGAYMEGCGFKQDNGFNSQSVTIMTYNELQDSLKSNFFMMHNFQNVQRELKKCNDSKH
jgi:hypothetical protein